VQAEKCTILGGATPGVRYIKHNLKIICDREKKRKQEAEDEIQPPAAPAGTVIVVAAAAVAPVSLLMQHYNKSDPRGDS
jgi:hypothetical protein